MWLFLGFLAFGFLFLLGLLFIILGSINPRWAFMRSKAPVYGVYIPVLMIGFIGPIVLFVVWIFGLEDEVADGPVPVEEESASAEEQESASDVENSGEIATRGNPASLGETVLFSTDHYMYGDLVSEVTILDTVRGDEATNIVLANDFNEPPEEGKEYLLAYVHMLISEVEEEPFTASDIHFDVVSEQGSAYTDYTYVTLDDHLFTDLYEGASAEGWIAFQIDEGDHPNIVFMRDLDGPWYSPVSTEDLEIPTDDEEDDDEIDNVV